MKITEILTEAKKSDKEIKKAYNDLMKIRKLVFGDNFSATSEEAKKLQVQAAELYKITGKSINPDTGYIYHRIYDELNDIIGKQGGERTFPKATAVKEFAMGIESFYNGDLKTPGRKTWKSSSGATYRDPDFIVNFPEEHIDLDDVWRDLIQRGGKQVYISDKMSDVPGNYLQFGNVLVGKSFDALTFQSTKILKNWYRNKRDITPQQANAIHDMARTRTANTLDRLRATIQSHSGPTLDSALAKILADPQADTGFKNKLKQIVAGAENYDDSKDY